MALILAAQDLHVRGGWRVIWQSLKSLFPFAGRLELRLRKSRRVGGCRMGRCTTMVGRQRLGLAAAGRQALPAGNQRSWVCSSYKHCFPLLCAVLTVDPSQQSSAPGFLPKKMGG